MTAPQRTTAERRMICAVVNRYGITTGPDGRLHATADSRELLLAPFCTHPTDRQRAERPEKARETAADAERAALMEKRRTADPAYAVHSTGDAGPWRAKVCTWGHGNGWPGVDSRQALDPALVAAYRAANPEET